MYIVKHRYIYMYIYIYKQPIPSKRTRIHQTEPGSKKNPKDPGGPKLGSFSFSTLWGFFCRFFPLPSPFFNEFIWGGKICFFWNEMHLLQIIKCIKYKVTKWLFALADLGIFLFFFFFFFFFLLLTYCSLKLHMLLLILLWQRCSCSHTVHPPKELSFVTLFTAGCFLSPQPRERVRSISQWSCWWQLRPEPTNICCSKMGWIFPQFFGVTNSKHVWTKRELWHQIDIHHFGLMFWTKGIESFLLFGMICVFLM